MLLSKRERFIAILTGASILMLVLYFVVIGPYFQRRAEIATDLDTATLDLAKADTLFKQQKKMRVIWTEMMKGGLGNTPSEAESQLAQALDEWAQECGINVSSLKPGKSQPEGKFLQIGFNLSGIGPLSTISNLLWRLETTNMPLRINDIQIIPRKEGQDDLTFQLTVSTLCRLPDSDKGSDKSQLRTASIGARGDQL